MTIANIIVGLILIVLTIGFLCLALYLRFRRRFTRDRYAFAALGATVTLVFVALASVSTAPPWTIIAALLAHIFDNNALSLPDPNWAEKALLLGFVAFAIWMLNRSFVKWDGPKSERQYKMSRLQDSSTLIREGITEVLRILNRQPASPMHEPVEPSTVERRIDSPAGARAWRDDAREMVELKWQHYIFDPDDGWHEKHNCWVGSDVKTKNSVALMCCHESYCQTDLLQFIEYVCSLPSVSESKVDFIVAVKTGEHKISSINSHSIRFVSEDSLLESLVDFTDYIVDIKRRVEKDALPDSKLTIADVYVPSEVIDLNKKDVEGTLEDYIYSWLAEPGQRHLAVLGEYGQGKSTGTLMVTHRLLTSENDSSHPIPLYLELRGKSPATLQPVELLGAWASEYRINPRALFKLLVKGRIFIIFEGFDEMSGVSEVNDRINHFRALWRFAYPDAKLLFTGRDNFFLDDDEIKAALGIGSGQGSGPYCEHIYLKPFQHPQIQESLRWASSTTRKEILSLYTKDVKFRDIVSRPSYLYIVGRLWRSPDFEQISETVDSAQVMGAFVNHCYRRQTEKHRGFPHFMVLTEKERAYFMEGITAFMAARHLPNQITKTDLEQAVTELYRVIPEDIPIDASLPEPFHGPLKKRLEGRDDAVEAVQTDVRTYGLLVRDYSRPNTLKYPHKSFFEYLLGAFVADCLLDQRPEYCASINSATSFNVVNTVFVPESLSFLGEILEKEKFSQKNPAVMMDSLLDVIVMPRKFRIPLLFRKLYLLLIMSLHPTLRKWTFSYLSLFMIGLFTWMVFLSRNDTEGLFNISIFSTGILCVLTGYGLSGAFRQNWNSIILWYAVARSLGISYKDMISKYGQITANAIQSIAFMHKFISAKYRLEY